MTAAIRSSVVCLFCDDTREEKAGTETIIGVMPDNLAVTNVPGAMGRLSIYVRTQIPIDQLPRFVGLRVEFPWGDPPISFGGMSEDAIEKSANEAKANNAPYLGLIFRGTFSPFHVKGVGRVKVIVDLGGDEVLAGSINIALKRIPTASPTEVISSATGDTSASPPLTFVRQQGIWNPDRETVRFFGVVGNRTVPCAITREALQDHFGLASTASGDEAIVVFEANRVAIELATTRMYAIGKKEKDGSILLTTSDF